MFTWACIGIAPLAGNGADISDGCARLGLGVAVWASASVLSLPAGSFPYSGATHTFQLVVSSPERRP